MHGNGQWVVSKSDENQRCTRVRIVLARLTGEQCPQRRRSSCTEKSTAADNTSVTAEKVCSLLCLSVAPKARHTIQQTGLAKKGAFKMRQKRPAFGDGNGETLVVMVRQLDRKEARMTTCTNAVSSGQ